jgi:hypothetical protein
MPVLLLDDAAAMTWLGGGNEEALALQQPANDAAVELLPLDQEVARSAGG